jgi:hypothetical protein
MSEWPFWVIFLGIFGALNGIVLACALLIDTLDDWARKRRETLGPREEGKT